MYISRLAAQLAMAAAGTLFATAAIAQPELLSSTPKDKSEGAAPTAIELKFSETLATQSSAASLTMTSMPGMANHGEMKMKISVAGAGDGKTMVITPASKLSAGTYRVDWRAVSSDALPAVGKMTFQVK
ncbi:Copper resistance protein C [Bordetella tumbae]|uniref:copper homeostasis periplasmic binding protein CopC n=1 Tax=Bordetella tumbae TaxID=1649139 RepID=UPI0039F11E4A